MANLSRVINELRRERDRLSGEVERLDNAIAALDHIGGSSSGHRAGGARQGRRPRRKLSAAARARIAAAQRARWAKVRGRAEKKAA